MRNCTVLVGVAGGDGGGCCRCCRCGTGFYSSGREGIIMSTFLLLLVCTVTPKNFATPTNQTDSKNYPQHKTTSNIGS